MFSVMRVSLDAEELFDSVDATADEETLDFIAEALGKEVVITNTVPELEEFNIFLSTADVTRLLETCTSRDGVAADIRDSLTRVYQPLKG